MNAHTENRREMIGTVRSAKMDKTVVVEIERKEKHAAYKKYVLRRKRYHVHDEKGQCQVGDKVLVIETRPLSKTKRWALKQIIEKAK